MQMVSKNKTTIRITITATDMVTGIITNAIKQKQKESKSLLIS